VYRRFLDYGTLDDPSMKRRPTPAARPDGARAQREARSRRIREIEFVVLANPTG
jgi:hypothetical protein